MSGARRQLRVCPRRAPRRRRGHQQQPPCTPRCNRRRAQTWRPKGERSKPCTSCARVLDLAMQQAVPLLRLTPGVLAGGRLGREGRVWGSETCGQLVGGALQAAAAAAAAVEAAGQSQASHRPWTRRGEASQGSQRSQSETQLSARGHHGLGGHPRDPTSETYISC